METTYGAQKAVKLGKEHHWFINWFIIVQRQLSGRKQNLCTELRNLYYKLSRGTQFLWMNFANQSTYDNKKLFFRRTPDWFPRTF